MECGMLYRIVQQPRPSVRRKYIEHVKLSSEATVELSKLSKKAFRQKELIKRLLGDVRSLTMVEARKEFGSASVNSLIKKGVNFIQPSSITVSYDTRIDKGVTVEPHTIIKTGVSIKKSSKILSGSYLEGCNIGKSCTVGPYARIRPITTIDDNVKIGNFVEIKNSKIGKFSSIAHLSYIGDAILGNRINIGAGTITCNYDGFKKNKTVIDDGVFVGANCSLIAPIKISKNATIGAGSVISKNIPISSLAIERSKLLILKKKKRSGNKPKL